MSTNSVPARSTGMIQLTGAVAGSPIPRGQIALTGAPNGADNRTYTVIGTTGGSDRAKLSSLLRYHYCVAGGRHCRTVQEALNVLAAN